MANNPPDLERDKPKDSRSSVNSKQDNHRKTQVQSHLVLENKR